LKEIELKITKIQQKNQQWVTVMQLRFTNRINCAQKIKTNMLSDPQDKPLMVRKLKIGQKIGKPSNFKPPLFERNHGKDHEDAQKVLR